MKSPTTVPANSGSRFTRQFPTILAASAALALATSPSSTRAEEPPSRFQLTASSFGTPSPTAIGGTYTLDSLLTPASPANGTLSGGRFQLAGGFWEAVAPSSGTPSLPALDIRVVSGLAEISWPATTDTYVLEESPSANGPWTPSSATPQVIDMSMRATLPTDGGQRFFRLRRL